MSTKSPQGTSKLCVCASVFCLPLSSAKLSVQKESLWLPSHISPPPALDIHPLLLYYTWEAHSIKDNRPRNWIGRMTIRFRGSVCNSDRFSAYLAIIIILRREKGLVRVRHNIKLTLNAIILFCTSQTLELSLSLSLSFGFSTGLIYEFIIRCERTKKIKPWYHKHSGNLLDLRAFYGYF